MTHLRRKQKRCSSTRSPRHCREIGNEVATSSQRMIVTRVSRRSAGKMPAALCIVFPASCRKVAAPVFHERQHVFVTSVSVAALSIGRRWTVLMNPCMRPLAQNGGDGLFIAACSRLLIGFVARVEPHFFSGILSTTFFIVPVNSESFAFLKVSRATCVASSLPTSAVSSAENTMG
jgi:hypothetical protein